MTVGAAGVGPLNVEIVKDVVGANSQFSILRVEILSALARVKSSR